MNYYKGRIKDKTFASARLSSAPHYFGKARIGKIGADTRSDKGYLFAFIENFDFLTLASGRIMAAGSR